jgi:hypothetical protein
MIPSAIVQLRLFHQRFWYGFPPERPMTLFHLYPYAKNIADGTIEP